MAAQGADLVFFSSPARVFADLDSSLPRLHGLQTYKVRQFVRTAHLAAVERESAV
jgi:hypothetical protein